MNIRKEIISTAKNLYEKGFLGHYDGNISMRDGNHFWITPSKHSKKRLNELDLLKIDEYGNLLEGSGNPSTETPMHLEVYKQRKDVNAVIHAHPPLVTSCTLAGIPLNHCVLPEVIIALGSIPTAKYATPCTGEGASSISELVRKFNGVALDRHGAITSGKNLEEAFYHIEKMEHLAKILLESKAENQILDPHEIQKILEICGKNLSHLDCANCNKC